jgi:hypothetical protein
MWDQRARYLHTRYDLTDEQVDTIIADARALFDEGASWDEIQDSVRAHLREYDAERTNRGHWKAKLHFVKKVHHFAHQYGLEGEELRDVVSTAREMHQNGVSPEEIRRTVREMVHDYAQDDRKKDAAKRLAKHLEDRFDLTNEQVREVVTLIKTMHEDGASRAEIKRAVHEKIQEYTDDRTDDRTRTITKRVVVHLVDEYDLTTDEIRTIVTEARDLRHEGATWEEVRDFITDRASELDGDDQTTDHAGDDARDPAGDDSTTDSAGEDRSNVVPA